MALSSDGLTWKRVKGPLDNGGVLNPNSEDWWAFDTIHTSCGSVLLTHGTRVRTDGGVYLMYYTGGDTERMPISEDVKITGGRTRIGVALSKDGEHFTRIEGEYPSSALLDVGDPPSFDDLFVAAPHVIYDPDAPPSARYVMYYHGANVCDRRFCIGRATSRDAFTFTRNPARKAVVSAASKTQVPDDMPWAEKGVCRPCVVQRGQLWVMFLEVIGLDSKHRIAMSESEDGIKWGPLVLVLDVGEPGEWDAAGVSHPCAVVPDDDDGVIIYYVGRREDHDIDGGRGTNIGMAQSIGPDWTQLERVSGGES